MDVFLEIVDGIATLTLNRPARLNALTPEMLNDRIPGILDRLAGDDSVRVLIVTGAGRGFCAGADVEGLATGAWDSGLSLKDRLLPAASYILKLANLPKPTIAAVNGVAAGGGFSLALACDFRIAADGARFVPSFLGAGTTPDAGISYFLPRIVGTARALEILMATDSLPAAEAERLGLVNRVVPADRLVEATLELARRLAQGPSPAVALTRETIRHSSENSLEAQMHLETQYQRICFASEDFQEAVRAFRERRAPNFRST